MLLRKLYTCVFVRQESKILLGMKKRGFGVGKWNGFGGKVEPGETIAEAAIRELQEECGLSSTSLKVIGCIDFEIDNKIMEVHFFSTSDFHGEIIETEEMKPKWFNVDEMPFEDMWPDNKIWFPWFLQGKVFKAYFLYEGLENVVKYDVHFKETGREI